MFKWLSCEHSYQFYNTRIDYDCMGYGYYSFEFVCPKCKKEISVSQREIDDLWKQLKSDYNKNIVLGGKEIKSSELTIPHYRDCDHSYCSPVATLMLRRYLIKGIDLTQISKKQRKCSYAEGISICSGYIK